MNNYKLQLATETILNICTIANSKSALNKVEEDLKKACELEVIAMLLLTLHPHSWSTQLCKHNIWWMWSGRKAARLSMTAEKLVLAAQNVQSTDEISDGKTGF